MSGNLSAGGITQADVVAGSAALSRGSSQAKTRPLLPMETTLTIIIGNSLIYGVVAYIPVKDDDTPPRAPPLFQFCPRGLPYVRCASKNCRGLLTTRGRSWGARSESWMPRTWPYLAQEPTVIHAAGYMECPNSYSATRIYA